MRSSTAHRSHRGQHLLRRLLITAGAATLTLTTAALPAYADPPSNDSVTGAVLLDVPSNTGAYDFSEATTDTDEASCGAYGGTTLWFQLADSGADVRITANGAMGWPVGVAVYTGTPGALTQVGCGNGNSLETTLASGTTYYLQLTSPWGQPVSTLDVHVKTPPANDDVANAVPLTLGTAVDVDTSDASVQPGEDRCGYPADSPTVWYRFTATGSTAYQPILTNGYYAVYESGPGFPYPLMSCGRGFVPTDGHTYLIQVVAAGPGTTLTLVLADPPAPAPRTTSWVLMAGIPLGFVADNALDPIDPVGGTRVVWNFGDGTTLSGSSAEASHTYRADGDYTVSVTSTTTDGRTGTGTTLVQVRTHDIAVVSFVAPTNARVGQVKTFTVGIRNTHYPEPVTVVLSKGGPGGWTEVSRVMITVPAKPANKTTTVTLSYLFTAADAAARAVSFQASAGFDGRPELQTTDNTMVAAPVRVTK